MEKNSGRGFPTNIQKEKVFLICVHICLSVSWITKLHECAIYSGGSLEIEHTLKTNILKEHL